MQTTLNDQVKKLRIRLSEYRYARRDREIGTGVSIYVGAVDVAVTFVEYGLQLNRPINKADEGWFHAGLQLAYVFENSEWEDIYLMYRELCKSVASVNYFRQDSNQASAK